LRALVCVQSRDERAQIRPYLSKLIPNITMVNSSVELMEHLKSDRSFDLLVLDDSFDAKSPDGEDLSNGPSVIEILQEIQAGFTGSPDITTLCLLRSAKLHDELGTVSVFVDSSPEDREQIYTELGATLFLEKPFNIETLNKSLQDLFEAATNPPPWAKALKQVRQLYNAKKYPEVLAVLEKISETPLEAQHLGFPLLKARCLFKMGDEHLPQAARVLAQLRERYPTSLTIRMLLLEIHLKLDRLEEAFREQLSIFATQKTAFNFERTLQLLTEIGTRLQDDASLLKLAHETFAVLFRDPKPYSRKLRPRVFSALATQLKNVTGWTGFVELLSSSDDVVEIVAPELRLALGHLEKDLASAGPELSKVFQEGHIMLLSSFPTEASSIEIATQSLLDKQELDQLDALLKRAESAGAKSLEFYTSLSRYFLKIGNLKEASDVLHKAVRLKADDLRVLELRELWQTQYDARNKPNTST
jgi:CheY-like chemotaxis protein